MKNRKEQKHVFLFNANLLGNSCMHVIDAMAFPSLSLFPYSIFTFFCTIYSRYQVPNIFAITFASAFFGTTKILVTFLIFSRTLSIATTLHSCKIWFWFFVWNTDLLMIFHLHSQKWCAFMFYINIKVYWQSRYNRGLQCLSSVSIMDNPGHHLVSPYSRNLIFGTGVGMNLQSYQCSFSN